MAKPAPIYQCRSGTYNVTVTDAAGCQVMGGDDANAGTGLPYPDAQWHGRFLHRSFPRRHQQPGLHGVGPAMVP